MNGKLVGLDGTELGTIEELSLSCEPEEPEMPYMNLRISNEFEFELEMEPLEFDKFCIAMGISTFKYENHVYPAEWLTELDKLVAYLKRNGAHFEEIHIPECRDVEGCIKGCIICFERHQVIVYKDGEHGERSWDAVCHPHSYGYGDGLLEIYGDIVHEGEDSVVGWLTAADIIERIENNDKGRNKSI